MFVVSSPRPAGRAVLHPFLNRGSARVSLVAASAATALFAASHSARAGQFDPAAGQPGSLAIAADNPSIAGWATGFNNLVRGPLDIASPGGGNASFGSGAEALGTANGTDSSRVVSLGDGGRITLSFDRAIRNGPGADFAVFENSFSDTFLELAFVEVSSNGTDFFRFASKSETQSTTQIGGFGNLDPTDVSNLAGKYRAGFGTPFDLQELAGMSPSLDVNNISAVRLIDVVGSITDGLATFDSLGRKINDPYSTPFASGGFDLDAVGVINQVPEPGCLTGVALAGGLLARRRRRR